jgi:hypothetical protein
MRQGSAWQGAARFGMAGRGDVRPGRVRHGAAWQGKVFSTVSLKWLAVDSRQGAVWRGTARRGMARHGVAWQGFL